MVPSHLDATIAKENRCFQVSPSSDDYPPQPKNRTELFTCGIKSKHDRSVFSCNLLVWIIVVGQSCALFPSITLRSLGSYIAGALVHSSQWKEYILILVSSVLPDAISVVTFRSPVAMYRRPEVTPSPICLLFMSCELPPLQVQSARCTETSAYIDICVNLFSYLL
jgi:hypothetical protein